MSYGSGSLIVRARRQEQRTILERVRYDGIFRCSRALFSQTGAATIVLSQLGPGVVRGDALDIHGHLGEHAHLIVTSQTATRLLGGVDRAHSHADWTVARGAMLELVGEPLVAAHNANYDASTVIELGPEACVLITDIACVPAAAAVRLRTSVRVATREVFYDAFEPAAVAPDTVGSFMLVGLPIDWVEPLCNELDKTADAVRDVEVGIGTLPTGAFARILGRDIWAVRCALIALRQAAGKTLAAAQRAGGRLPAVGSAIADDASSAPPSGSFV